jgi:hypothetical protein
MQEGESIFQPLATTNEALKLNMLNLLWEI